MSIVADQGLHFNQENTTMVLIDEAILEAILGKDWMTNPAIIESDKRATLTDGSEYERPVAMVDQDAIIEAFRERFAYLATDQETSVDDMVEALVRWEMQVNDYDGAPGRDELVSKYKELTEDELVDLYGGLES